MFLDKQDYEGFLKLAAGSGSKIVRILEVDRINTSKWDKLP